MPKIKEFNIEDYTDGDYRRVLLNELKKKLRSVSFFGATANTINIWGIKIRFIKDPA